MKIIKAKVKELLDSGKVLQSDLNCDLCDYNCAFDEFVYLDKKADKGYCERCFDEKV